MSDPAYDDLDPVGMDSGVEANILPGIVTALGELKPGAIVTEEGVARLFNRHASSVKRAIQRGELPPPCRLFGANVWTAGALVQHIENRPEQAAKEAERTARRIGDLSSRLLPRTKVK
jgi:hypothetical protein